MRKSKTSALHKHEFNAETNIREAPFHSCMEQMYNSSDCRIYEQMMVLKSGALNLFPSSWLLTRQQYHFSANNVISGETVRIWKKTVFKVRSGQRQRRPNQAVALGSRLVKGPPPNDYTTPQKYKKRWINHHSSNQTRCTSLRTFALSVPVDGASW